MIWTFLRSHFGPSQSNMKEGLEMNGMNDPPLPLHNQPVHNSALQNSPGSTGNDLPDEIEEQIQMLPEDKRDSVRTKVKTLPSLCHIQPHTDEGGDALYIGDAYVDVNAKCAEEWSADQQ